MVFGIAIAACSAVFYQETPIRQSDYQLLERTPALCVEVEPLPKNSIQVIESWPGYKFGGQTHVTSKVLQIWGDAELLHPTQALAEQFVVDLGTRFPRTRFHLSKQTHRDESCSHTIVDRDFDNRVALEMKAEEWNIIIGRPDYHLSYSARARLVDREQDRVMWVQTCNARERWQGEEVSRMTEQEIRMLFETVQVHARAIINDCSTYLLGHLEPLG